jgi:hypothetical protein
MTIQRVLLFLAPVLMWGQNPQDKMIGQSVQVLGTVADGNDLKAVSGGGGFIADAHHVITLMFCCNQTNDGKAKMPVVRVGNDISEAKLVWNGPGDIAILETKKELKSSPLQVIASKMFQKGQPAFTVQIPAKAAPTVAQSTADDMAQMDKVPLPVIRVKATSDSVDGGSALFDGCGNVMGINVLVDGGSQFAFIIDGVAEGLQKLQIQASVANQPCGGAASANPPSGDDPRKAPEGDKGGDPGKGKEKPKEGEPASWRMPQGIEWVGVGLIGVLIVFALRRGTRPGTAAAIAPIPLPSVPIAPVPPPVVVPKTGKPVLRGVAGQYAGAVLPLDGTTTMGRDPHGANLVFTSEADCVSKRHCSVRWDASRSVFVLQDLGSTNGTFLMNGERIEAGHPHDLRPGENFFVGDQRNQFEAGLD